MELNRLFPVGKEQKEPLCPLRNKTVCSMYEVSRMGPYVQVVELNVPFCIGGKQDYSLCLICGPKFLSCVGGEQDESLPPLRNNNTVCSMLKGNTRVPTFVQFDELSVLFHVQEGSRMSLYAL